MPTERNEPPFNAFEIVEMIADLERSNDPAYTEEITQLRAVLANLKERE